MQLISSNSTIEDDLNFNYYDKHDSDQEIISDRLQFIQLFGIQSPVLSQYDNQSIAERDFQEEEFFEYPQQFKEVIPSSKKKIKKRKTHSQSNCKDSKLLSENEFIEVCKRIEQCKQMKNFLSTLTQIVSKIKSQVIKRKNESCAKNK